MKICHCIKLNEQEKTAIKIVQGILHEMANDTMIYDDFSRREGDELDMIDTCFNDVVDYLENFGD